MKVMESEPENSRDSQNNLECLLASPDMKKDEVKILNILKACEEGRLDALRDFATTKGGLISDNIRRQAWPLLLGVGKYGIGSQSQIEDTNSLWGLPIHPDEDQVKLDVNRSFVHYPHGRSLNELLERQRKLFDLITHVLRYLPYLSYFQGYHDICQVFTLVMGPETHWSVIARLSALRIRDFMLPTFSQTLAQLHLIPSIIKRVNPKLWIHISRTQPFYALSGTLTMYSHDIKDYGEITRLFDVLLAREAVFSIYIFAQIVLQRSDELFNISSDEPEILHSVLSKIPNPLGIEALIKKTVRLFETHPPEVLQGWNKISSYSVLKTTRWPDAVSGQSLDDGRIFFTKQVKELKRAELRDVTLNTVRKYWKPALSIGIPVLVSIISFWLRDSAGTAGIF
ncbi:TBC1 domain family member 20 [Golovinomyces cichoracearum]|uniref:TBC1 domain family member 20 n=1 Tax=Golovinomyces cichoracearum TaxID=62708 RepID=A0A420IF45_9PEZI|nr:TBC1 domain family member 20 [Golovinomyces cichoracearum]